MQLDTETLIATLRSNYQSLMTEQQDDDVDRLAEYGEHFDEAIEQIRVDGIAAATLKIAAYINERPNYVQALKSSTDTDGDYFRWQGHAEARRQLATFLGWTVPHEPGEHTRVRSLAT